MNGYQPKKRCNDCTKQNDCKKYKDGKEACKKYDDMQPKPPKTLNIPTQSKVPPMPEIKPAKQCTVLSVRDFALLYNIATREITRLESEAYSIRYYFDYGAKKAEIEKEVAERIKELNSNREYQDLLRIRDKLGELNIEVETPSVEVEE